MLFKVEDLYVGLLVRLVAKNQSDRFQGLQEVVDLFGSNRVIREDLNADPHRPVFQAPAAVCQTPETGE